MGDRDETSGRFLNGHAGVGGRPRGSRVKLSEAFLSDLNSAWDIHGVAALRTCATTEPTIFCRIVAGILPKKIDSTLEVTNIFGEFDLQDAAQFAEAYRIAKRMLTPIPQSMVQVESESDRRDAEFVDDD
jgi:hypothetical protein